jgi:phospholipase C
VGSSRRAFLKGTLGVAGASVLGAGLPAAAEAAARHPAPKPRPAPAPPPLPNPKASGIEHVVVVMMENRSFDHLLGWLPRSRGIQAGLSYPDPHGNRVATWHANQLNGCGYLDPDHSYQGGRMQYAGGKMNGFLTDTANDRYAVSYYEAADRPFMSSLVRAYTTCDNYFCSILGPTYPNRFYQHSAMTDRLSNTTTTSTLPTIWDRLNHSGGPTGKYYFSDVPFLALWGSKYLPIAGHYAEFLSDAQQGTLPNVSFVDPRFEDEGSGTSGDDHPLADLRAGDAFLSEIFHAVSTGPAWDKTVLVINYDEWGGFFDHIPPPRVTAAVPRGAQPHTSVDKDQDRAGRVLLGLRVPAIVASPFTKGNVSAPRIAPAVYDHTSVLKLIEWRWGLAPLTARDASKLAYDPGNLATALNFSRPDPKVPAGIPQLGPFVPAACSSHAPAVSGAAAPAPHVSHPRTDDSWAALRASGLMKGWT